MSKQTLNFKKKTVIETISRVRAEITDEMLREAFNIPPKAKIVFQVPGGGDWSNTDIDISEKNPIVVTWCYQTMEEKEE